MRGVVRAQIWAVASCLIDTGAWQGVELMAPAAPVRDPAAEHVSELAA